MKSICKKKRFESKQVAKIWMKRFNAEHPNTAPLISVYQCLDCSMWHTTTMSKEEASYRKNVDMIKPSVSDELQKLRDAVKKHKK